MDFSFAGRLLSHLLERVQQAEQRLTPVFAEIDGFAKCVQHAIDIEPDLTRLLQQFRENRAIADVAAKQRATAQEPMMAAASQDLPQQLAEHAKAVTTAVQRLKDAEVICIVSGSGSALFCGPDCSPN
jgi:hypothetical protein